MSEVVVFHDGEIELNVSVKNETVWLNRNQIAELFDREVKTIGKHINNVFSDGELERFSVVAKFATTASDGKTYDVEYYNLDVIISVGYRVKSQKGVQFRQWATSVLKNYITNGYAINTHKITEQRLLNLENDVTFIKSQMKNNALEVKQGIFYDGQIFDAYAFVNELIKSAKNAITLKKFDLSNDRFLLIDDTIYHIGASLKDLGKKWFAFSKMDRESLNIIGRVE